MILVAFGGGVNSTAMLVGLREHDIRPDWVLFSDTKGEKPETYAHVSEVSSWCEAVGFPPVTTVTKRSMYASLEDECLRKNTLPPIAFGFRSCSDKWKQQPQERHMNSLGITEQVTKAIGFGVDELGRAKAYEDKKYKNWYPLIDWRWNRNDCIEAIKRVGLSVPPKSSCFFCPAMHKSEIQQLHTEHPDLWNRAIAMEKNATEAHTIKGLGRSFSWRDMSGPETVEQVCMCFDGDE